jgi:hypothetical protein
MANNQTTEMPNTRDIFAMLAMQSILRTCDDGERLSYIASMAYRMADAMLKERSK